MYQSEEKIFKRSLVIYYTYLLLFHQPGLLHHQNIWQNLMSQMSVCWMFSLKLEEKFKISDKTKRLMAILSKIKYRVSGEILLVQRFEYFGLDESILASQSTSFLGHTCSSYELYKSSNGTTSLNSLFFFFFFDSRVIDFTHL